MICPVINEYPSFLPGGMGVCCFPIMNPVDLPPEEFFNSEPVVELRNKLNSGNPPDMCKNCIEVNKLTGFTQANTGKRKLSFRTLSIARSSLCNRACRMCKPNLSTTLSGLEGKGSKPIVNKYLRETVLKYRHEIEVAYVGGGNPIQDKELWDILDLLDVNVVKLISFTSNGTPVPDELIERLSKFKLVTFNFSIDGDKMYNEAMRTFTKQSVLYDTMRSVISRTAKYQNIKVAIQPTKTNISIFRFRELYDEIVENIEKYDELIYSQNVCTFPEIYAPWNLPESKRVELKEKLATDFVYLMKKKTELSKKFIMDIIDAEKLVRMKEPNPELLEQFRLETIRFDSMSKSNLIEIQQVI